jgi:hypothetical protein
MTRAGVVANEGRASAMPDHAVGPRRRPLSREECLERLRLGTVARLARTEGALPRIEVVRYSLIGETLIFDVGSAALAGRLAGHVVAVESGATGADGPEDAWSVCAVGVVGPSQGLPGGETVLEMYPTLVHGWVDTGAAAASS